MRPAAKCHLACFLISGPPRLGEKLVLLAMSGGVIAQPRVRVLLPELAEVQRTRAAHRTLMPLGQADQALAGANVPNSHKDLWKLAWPIDCV
mmetsp:Transcript_10231/g.18676  ORF Transcript_10231/g.18676 Transcript_10231/m.18676 type:complete len:92 (+) Transcript_10231:885-1160(+)